MHDEVLLLYLCIPHARWKLQGSSAPWYRRRSAADDRTACTHHACDKASSDHSRLHGLANLLQKILACPFLELALACGSLAGPYLAEVVCGLLCELSGASWSCCDSGGCVVNGCLCIQCFGWAHVGARLGWSRKLLARSQRCDR